MAKQIDQSAQSERFKQAARELGCDESEERFDEKLKAIAKAPPQHRGGRGKGAKTSVKQPRSR
jgi:hypothetical protein